MLNDIYFILEKIENEKIQSEIEKELKSVTKWHKKTFADATIGGQLLKLEEEYKELVEAINKDDEKATYKELADVLIVCAGLVRLDSVLGNILIAHTLDKMSNDELRETLKGIRKKMKINRARKWEKLKDGRFKHK